MENKSTYNEWESMFEEDLQSYKEQQEQQEKEIKKLVREMSDEQIQKFLHEVQYQERVFIPQYYNEQHAKHYGFDGVYDMIDQLDSSLYQEIDALVESYL